VELGFAVQREAGLEGLSLLDLNSRGLEIPGYC